ncbi:YggS family pyridoxal phosphate-dependent enzyme [Blastopirellula sp. JC732]|uniref:Pyridoxal phosphate homeostasis protein n=1 Tax=Blastopirellula sediminis TaxID=2894196 RepID=A0A9X1MH79_9BACT|nr:YggS family pyridoxal phosphate-dependent enzyme [Blastopirellula sediminis]MCC9608199.1 YggS family pyridoxal phosphate-dependent enzyme [Blastopirellula sediminis]MCC9627008.1 YggS family pyridoxal phosphate-dependent enzyme [Blastopirellula sediminis]
MQTAQQKRLAENLAEVRGRIADAADRAGRSESDVRLIAVTKYVDVETVEALLDLDCHDLGESRPQQLWQRAEQFADRVVRWHMIGHLQTNKAKRTAAVTSLLHSGDSLRLLEALDAAAPERPLQTLLEINISGDAAKHGIAPDEAAQVLEAAAKLPHLSIRGLMGMAALEGGVDVARRNFAALRELRDKLAIDAPENVRLDELSMGMSGDFEAAIEEGATMVRVGSSLFEGI